MKKRQLLNWLDRKLPQTFLQFTLLRIRNSASGGVMKFKIVQTKNARNYFRYKHVSLCHEINGTQDEVLQRAIEEIFSQYGLGNHVSKHLPSIRNIKKSGRYKLFDLEVYVDIAKWDLQIVTNIKNMRL